MKESSGPELHGGCHCGALSVAFQLSRPAAETPVRECQCRFCRVHGARSATDPRGLIVFRELEKNTLLRYRFGHRLADFLICARCGTYIGACMSDGSHALGVVNINVLTESALFPPPAPVTYESETGEQRVARRRERWTPAQLVQP